MNNFKIMRKPAVLEITGISSATLWRKCKAGTFPKPITLGPNSVGWLEDEINNWITDLKAKRDGGKNGTR